MLGVNKHYLNHKKKKSFLQLNWNIRYLPRARYLPCMKLSLELHMVLQQLAGTTFYMPGVIQCLNPTTPLQSQYKLISCHCVFKLRKHLKFVPKKKTVRPATFFNITISYHEFEHTSFTLFSIIPSA